MRLTKKISKDLYASPCEEDTEESINEQDWKVCSKLGQHEDIEDELGIDLVTLFKAISNGIYVKTKNGISKHRTVSLMKWQQTNTYCLYYRSYSHIWFKDYGKTWALTKEELL